MKKKLVSVFGMITMLVAGASMASECELNVQTADSFTWPSTLSVPSTCGSVTVNLSHSGKMPKNVMGHNWVLSKTADVGGVASDGIQAYSSSGRTTAVKENDVRVIAATALIGGGEATSVTFSIEGLNAAESYTFFCSFPGHSGLMRGTFKIV